MATNKNGHNQNGHSWDQNSHGESPKQPHTKTTKTKIARSKATWKYLVSEWMLSLPTLTLLLVYIYYRPMSRNKMQLVHFVANYLLSTCSDLTEWIRQSEHADADV